MTNANTIATRRFALSAALDMTPNQPRTNMISGTWNIRPKAKSVFRITGM